MGIFEIIKIFNMAVLFVRIFYHIGPPSKHYSNRSMLNLRDRSFVMDYIVLGWLEKS